MKTKIIKRSDVPRTHNYKTITLKQLEQMAEQGKPLPRGHYLLVEAFYDGGINPAYEILMDAAGDSVRLKADIGCWVQPPYTWDRAWRTHRPGVARWLLSVLRYIKGVRVRIRWASPVKE
jgi:hypothetical protein